MSSGFKTMAEYYRIQSITVKSSLLKNSKWNNYEFNSNLEVLKISDELNFNSFS
jgi:hypothetical protein